MRMLHIFLTTILLVLVSTLVLLGGSLVRGESEDMMARAHYNMKTNDDLSLQVAEEGASADSKLVEADYDPYHGFPGGRANRRWVDVGTWESDTKSQGTITVNGSVIFNVWVSEIDEGFSNSCEFEFSLSVDGVEMVSATTSTVTSSNTNEVRTNPTGAVSFMITPETVLSLEIRYSGWEDINVYWDSYELDSGFRVPMDSLKILSYKVGKTSSSVKYADRFGVNWFQSAYASRIYVNETEVEASSSLVAKGEISDGNGSIPVYELSWSDYENPDDLNVSIGLSYSRIVSPTNETSWYLEGSQSGGDSDDDDEILGMAEDDAKVVFSGIALILVVLVVIFLILKRRRSKDEEERDPAYEDWPEEEEPGSDDVE